MYYKNEDEFDSCYENDLNLLIPRNASPIALYELMEQMQTLADKILYLDCKNVMHMNFLKLFKSYNSLILQAPLGIDTNQNLL